MGMLRGGGRNAGLAGGKLRNIVAVVEVALSFVLLIGSGLMVRSFIALQHVEPGFDPNHLLTFQLLRFGGGVVPKPEERKARVREIQTALHDLGGVESVTASTLVPLAGGYSTIRWGKEDALADPSKFQATDAQTVLPGFFETMRTPLIAGRTFTEADNAPDRKFAVIDTLLAAKAYPRESAIGKRILIRLQTPEPEWVEIIGVVAHQRATSLSEVGHEQIYFTDGFQNFGRVFRWTLRTTGDPSALSAAVRAATHRLDSNSLIVEMQPMSVWMDRAQAGTRFSLAADRRVFRDRGRARERRIVRRAFDIRSAANRRDRSAHGVGRRAVEHLRTRSGAWIGIERGGYRDRNRGSAGVDASDDQHAGRRAGDGSGDVLVDRRIVLRDRRGVVLDSRAASGRVGSDGRVAGVIPRGVRFSVQRRTSVRRPKAPSAEADGSTLKRAPRQFNKALNSSLNVPYVCARCCGRNPINTILPEPWRATTIAAFFARFCSPSSQPLCNTSRSA